MQCRPSLREEPRSYWPQAELNVIFLLDGRKFKSTSSSPAKKVLDA
jgi:hypothetical protein